MNGLVAVGLLILSWVVFLTMLFCHLQYENTLNRWWRLAGNVLGLIGAVGTTWFFTKD